MYKSAENHYCESNLTVSELYVGCRVKYKYWKRQIHRDEHDRHTPDMWRIWKFAPFWIQPFCSCFPQDLSVPVRVIQAFANARFWAVKILVLHMLLTESEPLLSPTVRVTDSDGVIFKFVLAWNHGRPEWDTLSENNQLHRIVSAMLVHKGPSWELTYLARLELGFGELSSAPLDMISTYYP